MDSTRLPSLAPAPANPTSTRLAETPRSQKQREKKRLSDRRSQQAVRERTKQHIAELEKTIESLLANDVNRNLKEQMQEVARLKEENLRLRRRLEHICQLASPNADDFTSGREQASGSRSSQERQEERRRSEVDEMKAVVEEKADTEFIDPKQRRMSQTSHRTGSLSSQGRRHGHDDIENTAVRYGSKRLGASHLQSPPLQQPAICQGQGHDIVHGMSQNDQLALSLNNMHSFQAGPDRGDQWITFDNDEALLQDLSMIEEQDVDGVIDAMPKDSLPCSTVERPNNSWPAGISNHNVWYDPLMANPIPPHFQLGYATATNHFGLPPMLNAQTNTKLLELFMMNTLEKYRGSSRDKLDELLPSIPCMAPAVAMNTCQSQLSRALAETLLATAPSLSRLVYFGIYSCIHRLLRYLLRPLPDEFSHVPANMRPLEEQKSLPISWLHFLPWPEVRKAMLTNRNVPQEIVFADKLAKHMQLSWPAGELIMLPPSTDVGLSGGGSTCRCGGPRLTELFESYAGNPTSWSLQ